MCLLDPKRRAEYDAALLPKAHPPVVRSQFQSAPGVMYTRPVTPPMGDPDSMLLVKPRGQNSPNLWLWIIPALAVVSIAVVIGLGRMNSDDENELASRQPSPVDDAAAEEPHADARGDEDSDRGNADRQSAAVPAPGNNPPRVRTPRDTEPSPPLPEPLPMNESVAGSVFPVEPPDESSVSGTESDETTPEITLPPGLALPADAAVARQAQQQWSDAMGCELEAVNTIEMPLVLIPPGVFEMGGWIGNDRTAQTQPVSISRAFYVGRHEVTQQEWRRVMGDASHASYYSMEGEGSAAVSGIGTNRFPVDSVTWFDAIQFCNALSQLESLPLYYQIDVAAAPDETSINGVSIAGGAGYRLLTEAEWEYACKAGTVTAYHFGEPDAVRPDSFNSALTDVSRTSEAESYLPNAFGLYDMHGNVWEWCFDWFDQYAMTADAPRVDPFGPSTSTYLGRLIRGGSYVGEPDRCMSITRTYASPEEVRRDIGFRVARTPDLIPPGERPSETIADAADAEAGHVNLLDDVNPELHADSRPWQRTEAGIVADNLSTASFLKVPGFVPEEYDLRVHLTIEREQSDPGSDVHISLPHAPGERGREAYPFVIRRIGNDTLLSFWPADPTNGEFGVEPLGVTLAGENPFAAGATISFQVRRDAIAVGLGDEQKFVFHSFGRAISSDIPLIKLGSWQNRVVFHSAELIPVAQPAN
jgi:formylglycine-generating enzyme required for sulfatase activity